MGISSAGVAPCESGGNDVDGAIDSAARHDQRRAKRSTFSAVQLHQQARRPAGVDDRAARPSSSAPTSRPLRARHGCAPPSCRRRARSTAYAPRSSPARHLSRRVCTTAIRHRAGERISAEGRCMRAAVKLVLTVSVASMAPMGTPVQTLAEGHECPA